MDETLPWYRAMPRRRAVLGRAGRPGRHRRVHRVVPRPRPGPRDHRRRLRHGAPRAGPGGHPPADRRAHPRHDRRRRGPRRRAGRSRATSSSLREAVLRYSREIAFAAAQVYAQAAEARGAWDARLEALVVDALLRGEVDEAVRSRASALGWGQRGQVAVVVGLATDAGARRGRRRRRSGPPGRAASTCSAPSRATGWSSPSAASATRCAAARSTASASSRPARSSSARSSPTSPQPRCRRPRRSPALRAAGAWPARRDRSRPTQLLPERALDGDAGARAAAGRRRSTRPLADGARRPARRRSTAFLERVRLARGRGAGAVRAPQHRALPAAPGRRGHRLRRRPSRAGRSPCASR